MNNDNHHDDWENLRRLLQHAPPGLLPKDIVGEVQSLIIGCWDHLDGSHAESTAAYKLAGRMEALAWQPPRVTFQIERHGCTVMGSSRAELHEWRVNVDTKQACCLTGGFRQIRPRNPALDVRPLVEKVIREIRLERKKSLNLKWIAPDTVRIIIGKLIPADCPKETLLGRRKRFKRLLGPRLVQLGWCPLTGTSPNTYRKAAPNLAVDRLVLPESLDPQSM